MAEALSGLLRLDLVKRHWRAYAFVCVAALLVHVAWLRAIGISPSTDFGVRYDPGARQLLATLGVRAFENASTFSIGAYGWSRIGYISFVAAGYMLFGPGLGSAVYPQLALVWLVYPLIFHTLLHLTRRPTLALLAMCVWLSYYDGYQWQFWAVPDALYRLIFVAAFFLLLRLWETGRASAFVCALLVALVLGTVFRIETTLYALPALWIAFGTVRRRLPAAVWVGALCAAAFAWVGRDALREIFSTFVYLQERGFVLPGSGMDVPGVTQFAHPIDHSALSWALYFSHLALARFGYAVTPFPALWSRSHRLYYAAYLLPAYVLAAFGFVAALRQHQKVFLVCFWIFAAGALLQVLVAVDPSMRYGYTPQVFLFFCAVMGWPALMSKVRPQWA
jgi:hypothetical protein